MKTTKTIFILILSLLAFSLYSQTIHVPADFPTIQEAIDEATDGSTIIIAHGTYTENLTISGKNLVIASTFLNTENEADVDATIINTSTGRVFNVSGTAAFTVEIIGLTIRDGSISGMGTGGGAIYQTGSVLVVDNCKFINNSTSSSGGAIQVWDARATIKNSFFSGNTSGGSGGAIHAQLSNNGRYAIIENCIFENNTATTFGGAISANLSTDIQFLVYGSYIQNNNANNGGGIYLSIANTTGPTPEIKKNVIANNTATTSGGGVYVTGRASRITNNTIVKNNLANHGESNKGAGMYFTGSINSTNSMIRNNIIKFNASQATDKEVYMDYSGTNCRLWMYYNCISPDAEDYASANTNGTYFYVEGNITDDPLFVDFANNDFNPQEGSPCIDAGDPDTNMNGETWEVDEEDRDPDGTRLDIGALYFHQDIEPQIVADFNVLTYGEFAPLTVEFHHNSIWYLTVEPTTWEWDFNNDGIVNSTEENPIFLFETPGTYSVKLTVGNGTLSNTVIKTDIIVVEDFGTELETIVIDFSTIEFYDNLCDETLVEQNVYFTGANSDPDALYCGIYTYSGAVHLNGESDLLIADFAQLEGEVVEVAIKFYDNCGANCTGATAYSDSDIVHSISNPESSSGNTPLVYTFTTDIDNPIDLFHFFGMESGLYKMYIKKVKQPEECEISAQIDVIEISCNEFAIWEHVEQNGDDYLVQWFVNGIEVDAEDISPITLEPGENIITLIASDIDDEECTTTVERTITVYNPDVTLNTTNIGLDLEFEVIVDGIDDFNFSWYFGDSGLGSGDDDQLAGTYTYTQEGTYEIAFTIMPIDNFSCAFNYSWEVTVGQTSDCDQGVIEGILDADLAVLVGNIISIELYKDIFIAMILVETTNINEDGEFIFENLEEGTYLLRAVINNPEDYPEYVVTYFNNLMAQAFQWQQASPIVLECDQTATIDLSMITIQDLLTGTGSASGYVFYSSEYDKNTAGTSNKNNQIGYEAAENIRVLLIDNDTHELVAQTQTGENGYYYFTQIPEGEYMISIDVVGYEHISNHVITITENDVDFPHLDYAIGNQEIMQAEIAILSFDISGNGEVLINDMLFEKTVLIDKDEELEIFAQADEDWVFVAWTGDFISADNPVTINMNEDKYISVIFEFETLVSEISTSINVYPNPFSDYLRIEGVENYHTISVYNNLGVQVYQKRIADNSVSITTSDFSNGMYYVVLSGNNEISTIKKLIKID